MAIIFAGNETDSFTYLSGNRIVTTNAAYYDANFCRMAFQLDSTSYQVVGSWATPVSMLWLHFDFYFIDAWTTNRNVLEIRSTTYGVVARLRVTGTRSIIGEIWDGSAWQSFGATTTVIPSLLYSIDVMINLNATTGSAAWYMNSNQIGSYSGDTQGFAATSIMNNVLFAASGNSQTYLSQVIVADEDTRGMKLATLFPTGAGGLSDWTGTFADVDEANYSDSDFISSGTANQGELFTMSDLSTAAQNGYLVKAVVQSARGAIGTSGPQNLQYYMYSNGTVSPSPNISGINNNLNTLPQYIWPQDPSTPGLDWTIANVNNLQTGFKSVT